MGVPESSRYIMSSTGLSSSWRAVTSHGKMAGFSMMAVTFSMGPANERKRSKFDYLYTFLHEKNYSLLICYKFSMIAVTFSMGPAQREENDEILIQRTTFYYNERHFITKNDILQICFKFSMTAVTFSPCM